MQAAMPKAADAHMNGKGRASALCNGAGIVASITE